MNNIEKEKNNLQVIYNSYRHSQGYSPQILDKASDKEKDVVNRMNNSLKYVFEAEQKEVRDDPGGHTNLGITQYTYNVYNKALGKDYIDVGKITKKEAIDIYVRYYMKPVHFGKLPLGLDYAVLDFGINSGNKTAIRYLQKTINYFSKDKIKEDGALGPNTLKALETVTKQKSMEEIIDKYQDMRLNNFKRLVTENPDRYGSSETGWINRNGLVRAQAVALAELGYPVNFGIKTNNKSKVKKLQKLINSHLPPGKKIKVDGIAGNKTQKEMRNLMSEIGTFSFVKEFDGKGNKPSVDNKQKIPEIPEIPEIPDKIELESTKDLIPDKIELESTKDFPSDDFSLGEYLKLGL